jgi:hypothetical protein
MLFIPTALAAKPNSRSMVTGSNVSACQTSSWFPAVDGAKLHPNSRPVRSCHTEASVTDHRARSATTTGRDRPRARAPAAIAEPNAPSRLATSCPPRTVSAPPGWFDHRMHHAFTSLAAPRPRFGGPGEHPSRYHLSRISNAAISLIGLVHNHTASLSGR